jgi:hypothetical protein
MPVSIPRCNLGFKHAEYLKTAAVLRKEREYKSEGKALISVDANGLMVLKKILHPSGGNNIKRKTGDPIINIIIPSDTPGSFGLEAEL